MKRALPFVILSLSGCAVMEQIERPGSSDAVPNAETGTIAPPATARTVEDFDTTTAEERTAAATVSSGGRRLGETIASLGDATLPGFWVMTDLVEAETPGRVTNLANGASVEVTLLPGIAGSARVSLAALRLLDAPLTDLVSLDIFAN